MRLLGFAIPDTEEDTSKAVEAEKAEMRGLLSGRRIAELALAPGGFSDPRVRAILDLISESRWLPLKPGIVSIG